ncbi:NADase-type glycan-binding domain-containing protein [Microscilla marina]|uniref:F5/8 type C domain protein n=1 Tax=Microscilla marina ATCC 23134 TaxID=313606 RepID=A1ZDS9_MICM2|nr:discoidin domain-containing protein [Microscilla marina]EAY31237.1 F5/8 type C domain protein [Microscilla marina ATCC 23134]
MKTKKTIFIVCLTAIFSWLVIGCGEKKEQSASDRAQEFSNRLIKVINEFENERTQALEVITISNARMGKDMSSSNMSAKKKADNYERDWKKIAVSVKAMEAKFNAIEQSSKAYFNQLYSINESISSDDLRKKEFSKNTALKKNWDKVYQKAQQDMRNIKTVLEEGNDLHKVLISSVMRSKITDNVSQMHNISSRARKVVKELSSFSVESKKILQGGFTSYRTPKNKATESTNQHRKNQETSGEQPDPTPKVNNDAPLIEVLSNEINASSYLSTDGFVYKPANVNDNDLKTWWSPKRDDFSTNWLQVIFDSAEPIRAIEVHGGSHYPDYPKHGDIFRMNHRVKTATLEFSDGSKETIRLKDIDAVQEFQFRPRNTRYIILKVKTWYPSERWKDICVSHFKAFK